MVPRVLRLLVSSCLCVCMSGCDWFVMDREYPILLKNDSEHVVVAYVAINRIDAPVYPDTTLPSTDRDLRDVFPKRTSDIYSDNMKHRDVFRRLPFDTLSIYLLHPDTIRRYSWDEIRKSNKILIRYDLSLQDLERLNETIAYPPDTRMAGIRMYP